MIVEIEQRTPEWLAMRCGMVTASRLGDVIKKLAVNCKSGKKGEPAATRANYAIELACERLTGFSADHYVTPYMEWGMEWEEVARAAYQIATGLDIQDGGFAIHPQIEQFGASIDFRVGTDGGGEIKCLKAENHYRIVTEGVIPDEHLTQMVGEMACYDLNWIDFVAFNKYFPKKQRLFVKRLWRDETVNETIGSLLAEIKDFLREVRQKQEQFTIKEQAMVNIF